VTYFEAFMLLIGGIYLGGEAVRTSVRFWRMMFGSRAQGTIVSQEERVSRYANRSRPFFSPVVEFVAPSGETVKFKDEFAAARKLDIGGECAVAYASADPAGTAVVVHHNHIVGLLICAVVSLALVAGSFWLFSGGASLSSG
jgi:hypothetical protein